MSTERSISLVAASGLLFVAALLVVDRGGLLAWTGVALGAALTAKAFLRPEHRDALVFVGVVVVWVVAWAATWAWVRSTWESGEVVELEVAGRHTARVWVIDTDAGPVMYYDAPPDAVADLLEGAPLVMTRDGQMEEGCADASRVEDLPAERVDALLGQMEEKYADRNAATDVFYVVLGVERDRVGLVVEMAPCG